MAASEGKGLGEALLHVAKNPMASAEIGYRSMESSGVIPTLLSLVPNPAVRAVGAFAGSITLERLGTLSELMRERYPDIDLTNNKSVEDAIASDPEFWQTAMKQANTAGVIKSLGEALSAAIAGPASKVTNKNPLAKRLLNAISERLIDMGIAGASEYTGETGKEIAGGKTIGQALQETNRNISNVAWEIGGEAVGGAPQLGGALLENRTPRGGDIAPPTIPPLRSGEAPATKVETVQAPPPRDIPPVRGIAPPEAVTGRVEAPVLMNPPRVVAPLRPVEVAGPPVKSQVAKPESGLGTIEYIEAKKNPDGTYRLYFRGTKNEIFPGEKFASAQEARQYWQAEKTKESSPPSAKPAKPAAGEGEIAKEPWMMTRDDLNYKWDYSEKGNPRVTNEAARVNSDRVNAELIGKVKVGDTFEWVGKDNQKRNATITKVTPAGKNETFAGEWFTVELDEHPYRLPGTEGGAAKTMDGLALADLARNGFDLSGLKPDLAPAKSAGKGKGGEVGGKLSVGEVVLTASGRNTTPFPAIDTSTNIKAANTVRRVDAWLRENAIAEAESRGDRFNGRQFTASDPKKLSQADKDGMEEYLFGEQPPVVSSILKPITVSKPSPAPVAPAKSAEAGGEKVTSRQVVESQRPAEYRIKQVGPDPEFASYEVYGKNEKTGKWQKQFTTGTEKQARKIITGYGVDVDAIKTEVPTVPRKNAAVAKEAKKRVEATPAPEAKPSIYERMTAEEKADYDYLRTRKPRGLAGKLPKGEGASEQLARDIKAITNVGKAYVREGMNDFTTWSKAIVDDFGDWVKEHLPKIWAEVNPSTAEKPAESPTAVKYRVMDAERAKQGLPPLQRPSRRSFDTVMDDATRILAQNPRAGEEAVAALVQNPRPYKNDTEVALVLHRKNEVRNARDVASKELFDAQEKGDTAAALDAEARVADNETKIAEIELALTNGGASTLTARALSALRMEMNPDFSLAELERQARVPATNLPPCSGWLMSTRQNSRNRKLSEKR